MDDELKNPFEGYLKKLEKKRKKPINPVHEIVNIYYEMRGWDKMPKSFFQKRERSYGKLAYEAKKLYEVLGHNLDDCIWAIDRMKYLAEKGNFEWTIATCLKHKKM